MRDLLLTLVVFGLLPRVVVRPDIGVLLWTWLSLMNPHKLSWSYAHDFPFAMVVALVTLSGLLIWNEPKKIPGMPVTILLGLFIGWMFLTTLFAVDTADAWMQWNKVWKIQLMTFVIMMVMTTQKRLESLIWVIALSLGFYGFKGGLFTLRSGGGERVWGPAGTFIEGNNEIALALIMTVPLLRYLQLRASQIWVRRGMGLMMVLSLVAILGTQSRGALVGGAAMVLFLIAKSRNRTLLILSMMLVLPFLITFMPESWHARMSTITNYQQDGSAMGRINAWTMAFRLAVDRPLGAGFEGFTPMMFWLYAPNPNDVHDAHSIYFEVLGEHGFIGLALFLSLGFASWRLAASIIRDARNRPSTQWLADLALMIQVSLVGYASGGAFLGMAYFDLTYSLIASLVVGRVILDKQLRIAEEPVTPPLASTAKRYSAFVRPVMRREG